LYAPEAPLTLLTCVGAKGAFRPGDWALLLGEFTLVGVVEPEGVPEGDEET